MTPFEEADARLGAMHGYEPAVTTEWAMQCNDGCALTIWTTAEAALGAARSHVADVGHRVLLASPGSWVDWPGRYRVSVSPDA